MFFILIITMKRCVTQATTYIDSSLMIGTPIYSFNNTFLQIIMIFRSLKYTKTILFVRYLRSICDNTNFFLI